MSAEYIIKTMISVIILSYNTRDVTLKCLDFLTKSKEVELETIVIDNASTDGSAEAIAKQFPLIKLIKNTKNIGFAAGCNQGMEMARGYYVLLLNSDCFVQPDTIAKCVSQKMDVVGCKLLNADGSIQYSWGFFVSLRRAFMLMSFLDNFPLVRQFVDSIHVRDLSRYSKTQEVDWVTGAFVLLKKDVYIKVGGIDEQYFMYGEEMEWMYRMKKAGFKVLFYPEASATHLQGASTKSLARMFVSEMRGYIYWFSKHRSGPAQIMLKIILVKGCLFKALAWTLIGKPELGRQYWQAFSEVSGLTKTETT